MRPEYPLRHIPIPSLPYTLGHLHHSYPLSYTYPSLSPLKVTVDVSIFPFPSAYSFLAWLYLYYTFSTG
jgi:hypothetical protein